MRRFIPFQPNEIINGTYGEWIILILLCGLFIAIAGAVLPKRLTEKRYGKALVVFTGLILGFGLYMAKDLYNFNLESFGFLAIMLIIIVAAFVTYGLIRMGMNKALATSLTYCLVFLTFFLMTPSIFDSIAQSLPILNLIFIFAAIYLFGNMLFKMFISPKPATALARDLAHADVPPQDQSEIEKEIDFEKKERKLVKGQTIKLTKKELKSIDHIYDYLKEIEKSLKQSEGMQITEDQKQHIAEALHRIGKTREDFLKGLNLLKQHVKHYRARDQNKINELQKRFYAAKEGNKKHRIKKEVLLEKRKLEIFEFFNSHYNKIMNFLNDFDLQIQKAVIYIKENNTKGAIHPVQTARNHMNIVWHVLKELKKHELYLLRISKKEEKILKKEKKGN